MSGISTRKELARMERRYGVIKEHSSAVVSSNRDNILFLLFYQQMQYDNYQQ